MLYVQATVNQLPASGVELSMPCAAVSTGWKSVCRPRFVEVVNVWEDVCTGDRTLPSPGGTGFMCKPNQPATSQWTWGFHTVWGVVDPKKYRRFPRIVRVVRVYNFF